MVLARIAITVSGMFVMLFLPSTARAQMGGPFGGSVQHIQITPEMMKEMAAKRSARPSNQPSEEPKKPAEGDSEKTEEDESGKKEEEKEGEGESSDTIKRPTEPPRVPDPREFDAKPDKDGQVRFSFYGQTWPDVLQWVASISNFSLDWQELPNDYINVTTERSYTVPEARDLINRLLLDRGYTMVEQGRILSVVKTDKLDPSLLQRVEDESELMDLPPHQFVKITFKLPDKLIADKAAEDIKPLLSPNAKVQPLLATNRLLVIDAVTNLRDVSRLINSEHAAAMGHEVPREFMIQFARAADVADHTMILLGLDPSTRRSSQELQVEQQRLQLFQQMQQKGKDVTKYLRKGDMLTMYLAVNERNNSILVNAPPAEMKIIERAIQQLDVPSASAAGAMSGLLSMEKYQLVTISPQSIVSALEQIGDLDPLTRLRTDSDAKIVFAHATSGDHSKIQTMIDRLDGTGRQLEVIWLRRLPAEAVAATLVSLLIGDKEKETSSRNSYYSPYYSSRSRSQETPKGDFRADADVERNRLLLWANESEMAEVRRFLEKLGEIPGQSGNPHTVRFLEPRGNEDTARILEQLRQVWDGPNELQIQAPAAELDQQEDEQPTTEAQPAATEPHKPTAGEVAGLESSGFTTDQEAVFVAAFVDRQQPSSNVASPREDAKPNAPITVTVTADGRITLSSDDTIALDGLEDLISSLTPPAPDFEVFSLKYASASMVTLNLEEYFEDEGEADSENNWWRAYYGMNFEKEDKGGSGLSQQKKIRFIYDFDTNTILVSNASPAQLNTVKTLIELYDVPPSEDSISARSFEMFRLKYSRADLVAKTVKEVFRDLLSSKDKDFDAGNEKRGESQSVNYYRISGSGDDNKKQTKVRASFDGALSVGVDEVSNSVIVSAQEDWMPTIAQMIEYLDENAKPETTVFVHPVHGQTDGKTLEAMLSDIVEEAWLGDRPPKAPPQKQPKDGEPQKPANGKKAARKS